MHLFDPKAHLLTSIAETLTSDLKAGFIGRQTRQLALRRDLKVRKDARKVKCFPLRFISWGNKAIPWGMGGEVLCSH